jgi:ribosome-associated protein
MLDSLTKAVLENVKKDFSLDANYEGRSASGWLLIDLGDIIVHLFSPDQREYYGLEQLWERGKVLLHLQ